MVLGEAWPDSMVEGRKWTLSFHLLYEYLQKNHQLMLDRSDFIYYLANFKRHRPLWLTEPHHLSYSTTNRYQNVQVYSAVLGKQLFFALLQPLTAKVGKDRKKFTGHFNNHPFCATKII